MEAPSFSKLDCSHNFLGIYMACLGHEYVAVLGHFEPCCKGVIKSAVIVRFKD